ncbi:hypothetical protein Sango_2963400 [Sesamum angolense]|uniref:DUF4283 domain-containing protein n=1 Tax=Sesamum angolense TaxID=2727404 RepID=A0AAE1VUP4_9LAMI|nr:hypothetical protein Sango_2963400 [Sesamum angolense]
MEDVIEGGPWLYLGQPIVLQKWEPGMVLRKLQHKEVPVWIKLRHLPVELWTTEGLSTVASGIGRPLYPDAITRACTRLDFARVNRHARWMWSTNGYHLNARDVQALVIIRRNAPYLNQRSPRSIYVRKSMPITPAAPELKLREQVQTIRFGKNPPKTEVDRVCEDISGHGRDKGVLSRWRWFVDYTGPGNRIWIAWNDELIEVDILNVGSQFMHCRVLVHEVHETILITVVYGANEVSTRRELWQGLIDLAVTIGNEPWLVGGDFNAVLDMSEFGWSEPLEKLDRLLVNDVWMDRWPNLYYTCLTPRTSDHSPMVLKGTVVICRRCKGDLAMNVKLAAGFLEIMLRQRAKIQWLKGGDQCSKIFFRRVATRRANKRVFQITDDDGNEQRDPTVIRVSLWIFFQGLLGGDRTERAIDLRYLRPWARHILTDDEARVIIRSVTIEEVKTAFFDIEEDKAPRPDGFSSGFFKAAWPVVGEEVSKAIIDFFKTASLETIECYFTHIDS